jgi:uncharacterized protein YodC (DUF2158 family)
MLGYARILNQSRGDLVENPLKLGELVRLRSGGPVMTVMQVREVDGAVDVVWHDRVGAEHASGYPMELLQRVGRSFFGRRR